VLFESWPTFLALWTVALGFGLAGYLLGRHAAWWARLPLLLLFLGLWVPVQESELADGSDWGTARPPIAANQQLALIKPQDCGCARVIFAN
jgi:hypothetical protein